MTGGRDSDDEEPSNDSQVARLLMVAVLALAVVSTAVLVLTSSAAWLRLGVLAALWAALLGVFLASRFRKTASERENQVADLQSVYELELEREVAARREYEQEVEASARKRVEEENRHDLGELRAELRQLRESLERLTGGEVLVERFALQARSTRMRALGDAQTRVVASTEDSARIRRSIMAGQQGDPAATELIKRPEPAAAQQVQRPVTPVRREPQRRPEYRPEPSRPQLPREGSDEPRQDVPAAQQPTHVARPVRPEPRQQPVQVRRAVRAPEQQARPAQAQPPAAARQAAAAQSTQRTPAPQRASTPQLAPTQQHAPAQQLAQPQQRPPTQQHTQAPQRVQRPPTPSSQAPQAPQPVRVHQAAEPQRRPTPEPTKRAEPVSRHRVEDVTEKGTGGHRRGDETVSEWQDYREWRPETPAAPEAQAKATWHTDDPETTGAHAAGTSVTELLAAHGKEEAPRRHRRRAE